MLLFQEHTVSVRIETISLRDRVLVGANHILLATKRTYQHEQRRLRQMKIREHTPHHPEFESRINEEVRLSRHWRNSPAALPGRIFERPDGSGAHGDNASRIFQRTVNL